MKRVIVFGILFFAVVWGQNPGDVINKDRLSDAEQKQVLRTVTRFYLQLKQDPVCYLDWPQSGYRTQAMEMTAELSDDLADGKILSLSDVEQRLGAIHYLYRKSLQFAAGMQFEVKKPPTITRHYLSGSN